MLDTNVDFSKKEGYVHCRGKLKDVILETCLVVTKVVGRMSEQYAIPKDEMLEILFQTVKDALSREE